MKHLNSLIALAMVATLSAPAFAGNGHGYGGPDLAAEVIPQEFNGITLDDIGKAADICLLEGDASRGVVSFAQRVIQTLYPDQGIQKVEAESVRGNFLRHISTESMTAQEWQDAIAAGIQAESNTELANKIGLSTSVGYGPTWRYEGPIQGLGNSAGYRRTGPKGFNASAALSVYGVRYSSGVVLGDYQGDALNLSFANANGDGDKDAYNFESRITVAFKEMNYLPKYDRFGRIKSSTLSFDGVTVRAAWPVLRFVNAQTYRPLDLTISQKEAVNCLRTELQKASK